MFRALTSKNLIKRNISLIMKPPSIYFTHELTELLKPFVDVSGRPLTLIIHAGTPKTGTSSMQSHLDKNQKKMRNKDIFYPHNIDRIKNPHAPKHQRVEKKLVTTHADYFLENFKNIMKYIEHPLFNTWLKSVFYNEAVFVRRNCCLCCCSNCVAFFIQVLGTIVSRSKIRGSWLLIAARFFSLTTRPVQSTHTT
ncbi:MAG: hypothetical protein ACI9IA_000252 [Enterobacterales bacterium]|jgi:hypothetical protein